MSNNCKNVEIFIQEWKRMCSKNKKYSGKKTNNACSEYCPFKTIRDSVNEDLTLKGMPTKKSCRTLIFDMPIADLVPLLQAWSDSIPVCTYRNRFFEFTKKPVLNDAGYPVVCTGLIFGFDCPYTNVNTKTCQSCWDSPFLEEGDVK